jgi:hypothetical protein
LAAPSKSSACRRASDAMKAGVSPQADDMHKILKYMGGEYSTAWERKIAKFEKKQGKKAEKVVKKTEKIVKKEKFIQPSTRRTICPNDVDIRL